MDEITGTEDILDIREVIERFKELEEIEIRDDSEDQEYQAIKALLDELKGCGGDEEWRGDWYPLTLIKESYFEEYCEQLLEDIGDIPRDIPSYIVIDWEKTADNLRVDYSYVSFFDEDYLYR